MDVCSKCNNIFLSELDEYGKSLIDNNFLDEISANPKDEKISQDEIKKMIQSDYSKQVFNANILVPKEVPKGII